MNKNIVWPIFKRTLVFTKIDLEHGKFEKENIKILLSKNSIKNSLIILNLAEDSMGTLELKFDRSKLKLLFLSFFEYLE